MPEQERDESLVVRSAITISPMQPGYAFAASSEQFVEWWLADLPAADAEASD